MRRTLITLTLLGTCLGLLGLAVPGVADGPPRDVRAAAAPKPRPNIVLVMTDDMAASDLRAMPITRRLIKDRGVAFDDSFSPYPLCCPARVTVLTGQYAHNHGVLGNADPPHPEGGYMGFTTDENTVATWVDRAGYQTALVGKYLNGYGGPHKPARVPPGWDEWYGTTNLSYRSVTAFENGTTNTYPHTYRTTWVNRLAQDIIERRVPRKAPLMLFVWQEANHNGPPIESDDPRITLDLDMNTPVPGASDRNAYRGTPLPRDPSFNEADVSDKPVGIAQRPLLSQVQVRGLKELHQQRLETLSAVDRGVKGIVAALRAAGELGNTLIVFTSDNGYMMGEHRIIESKTTPYEPSVRVPMLMRGPGINAGTTRDQLVGTIDLAPTFTRLAEATPRRVLDGVALMPLARDPQAMDRRDIVIEVGPGRIGGPMLLTGLRTARYTYVERATGARELYDLREDPYQLENLIGDPGLDPELEARLVEQLDEVRNCAGKACRVGTRY